LALVKSSDNREF